MSLLSYRYVMNFQFSKLIWICVRAHDKCAPKKSKYITPNNSPFMNKKISKAIMDATRPRNKFLKNRSPKNKFA